MTSAWPATISQDALQSSYTEEPQRNVVSFEPEAGIVIERRRSSISTDAISFTSVIPSSQWDLLMTFYRDTLKDGVLPFTRRHPRSNSEATFKFTAAPTLTAVHGAFYRVSFQMVRMP